MTLPQLTDITALADTALWVDGLRIAFIIGAAWVIARLGGRLAGGLHGRVTARISDPEQIRRAETLGRILRYAVSVSITVLAILLILSQLGISIAPILGAAGVVGVAVGFGAQSLVRDYFTGISLLLENQLAKGDVVTVAGLTGAVEDLTLRYIQLRDYQGNVHYVPNGLISTVTNMSRGHAYAVIDVGVAYRENLDAVIPVLLDEAARFLTQPAIADKVLEPFEFAGVEALGDSAVTLRGRFKVKPLEQWTIRREFLRAIKQRFDREGIEIPFPHLTVYAEKATEVGKHLPNES
jgi:small conductance mechanosensitive channel